MKSTIRFYATAVITFIIFILFIHILDRRAERLRYQKSNLKTAHTVSIEISAYFFEIIGDLFGLSQKTLLFRDNPVAKRELSERFKQYALIQKNYHQIRFIDLKGKEIVRVNYNGQNAVTVPFSKLQNVSKRDYFKKAISLNKGEVYISRFHLNLEKGEIEKPMLPIIRLTIPVFNKTGEKKGILVINYMGEHLLKRLALMNQESKARLMLLNQEGYWLYSDNEADNGGFQLPWKRNIIEDYQDEWEEIIQKSEGQITSKNGLFTFTRADVQTGDYRIWQEKYSSHGFVDIFLEEKPWEIVVFIDPRTLLAEPLSRLKFLLLGLLVSMFGLLPVSVIWGKRNSQGIMDKKRNETFAKIIEQSDELIYVTEPDSKIIFANKAFERHTGYTINEAIGQTPRLIKSGMHPKEFYSQLFETIQAGKDYHAVVINRKKDGTIYHETKMITSLKDADGNIEYYVSIGSDISETHKNKERELENTTLMSSAISHHFNNILNVIINYVNLAMKDINGSSHEKSMRYLQTIFNIAQKAEDLVEKIFYSGHQQLVNLPKVSAQTLIVEIVNIIKKDLPTKITVNLQMEEDLPNVKIKGNLIGYALRALIKNSEEAIENKGEVNIFVFISTHVNKTCVTCGTPVNGKYFEIFVQDNGCGIDPSIMDRVFDPFFSNKEGADSVIQTPGLGLTAVRGILHAHRGHILLESSENTGTGICLLLPLDD
ncbi:MAG: PAS domain S-box protein [Leptospirales bacterium]